MPPSRKLLARWLPRLLLLAFAASLFLPLPRYLRGLEAGEFLVWLSQVAWVLGLLLVGALGVGLLLWWRRRG